MTAAVGKTAIPGVESLTYTEKSGLTTRWGRYLTEVEQRAVTQALKLRSVPTDALEVGCQGGRWSDMLVRRGWRVTCTDVDEPVLRGAQERLPTARCILVQPDDQTIPCESGSADLLLCIEVVPVIHSDWFVSEADRVLRPGSVLVGVFLNRRSIRGLFVLLREKFKVRPTVDAAFIYSKSYKNFKRELQGRGFEFVFERGFCWPPFSRDSHSPLIGICTFVERMLGLQRLPGLSPWVVFTARKLAKDSPNRRAT